MTSEETDRPSEAKPSSESDQLATLSLQKLELEIALLRRSWWRVPTNWGSIATISAAVLGFMWAVTSGFFDVSRRELDVSKRELQMEIEVLQQQRNEQAVRFRAALATQQRTISSLNAEAERLRSEVTLLDRPVIAEVDLPSVLSFRQWNDSAIVSMNILGYDFGTSPGRVSVNVAAECSISNGVGNVASFIGGDNSLTTKLSAWSTNKIAVQLSLGEMRAVWAKLHAKAMLAFHETQDFHPVCTASVLAIAQRADGKRTNRGTAIIPDTSIRNPGE